MKELERISDGAKGWRFLTFAVIGGVLLLWCILLAYSTPALAAEAVHLGTIGAEAQAQKNSPSGRLAAYSAYSSKLNA